MPRLSPSLAAGGGLRRPPFDVRRVARRRAGGVGGVLIQALGKLIDLLLQGVQPLLILLDEGEDRRLGSRWDLVPQLNRDRRNRRHSCILQQLEGRTSSDGERLRRTE